MKRGQAAMEFLMTYGWAILVVLVAISALAYFGALSPDKNLPETCIFFPGISCDDFKVDSNSVTLIVINGGGKDLENIKFTILGTGPCEGDSSTLETLDNGETKTFTITCSDSFESGNVFKRDVQIDYKEINGLDHTKVGQLNTRVE